VEIMAVTRVVKENDMKMFTLEEVHTAAIGWYGSDDLDSCCLAENRLNKGEKVSNGPN
tara:strand:+ start:1017 stop:1190 length:174 start_codon:yes stop_codon:yes gene_type:complete